MHACGGAVLQRLPHGILRQAHERCARVCTATTLLVCPPALTPVRAVLGVLLGVGCAQCTQCARWATRSWTRRHSLHTRTRSRVNICRNEAPWRVFRSQRWLASTSVPSAGSSRSCLPHEPVRGDATQRAAWLEACPLASWPPQYGDTGQPDTAAPRRTARSTAATATAAAARCLSASEINPPQCTALRPRRRHRCRPHCYRRAGLGSLLVMVPTVAPVTTRPSSA
jgi:hypothetical protein